jgi:hypothetical protein
MARFLREVEALLEGVIAGSFCLQREEERNQGEKNMLTGGAQVLERERWRGRGAGPVRLLLGLVGPRARPRLGWPLLLLFFF